MKTIRKTSLQLFFLVCAFLISNNGLYAAKKAMSDELITNAVSNELLFNATTPSYLIDVETNKGIVTLTGEVDNILAK